MFEIDKVKFGAFVAQLRKERGYTKKELAQKLYISDKAVSKWETGVSIPDVALLIPLAELLDVTVTELLECKRMEVQQPMEEIVKKAVRYSEEEAERIPKTKRIRTLLIAVTVSVLQVLFILSAEGEYTAKMTALVLMTLLGTVFGSYFWIFAQERLPLYYDENRISAYSDGFFRMNAAPWMVFNNSNWSYILRVGRIWTLMLLNLYPILFFFGTRLLGNAWTVWGENILTIICLCGLIIPMYIVGKKYE